MLPPDAIVVERTRSKFVEKEIIVPRSHTIVFLNERGRRAIKKFTPEENRWLSLDGTGGGGYNSEDGSIHFDLWKPVHKQWRKVRELLNRAEKRRKR